MAARARNGTSGVRAAVLADWRRFVAHWDTAGARAILADIEAGAAVEVDGRALRLALWRAGDEQAAERFTGDDRVYLLGANGSLTPLPAG